MFVLSGSKISMMRKVLLASLAFVFATAFGQMPFLANEQAAAANEARPFPQQQNFTGIIKPNHVNQASLNTAVSSYYDYWKGKYLKNNLSSLPGGYYVKGEITGSAGGFTPLGTSEGQGFGMIITVLMAGYDSQAQTIYNGLFKTARAYKSSVNSALMGWVVADHANAQGNFSSATDGDLDIAYSLILAHHQWGSSGTINYLQEAKTMINAIKASNVTNQNRLNLGDWDSKNALNSRPSDWMFSHLRAFHEVTGDNTWLNVIDALYTAYSQVSDNYASSTGLISDFIVANPAKPAPEWYLNEFKETNQYYYNASRVPFRVVMDYAFYGETRAKNIADKMAVWIKGKTGGSVSNVKAGYSLSGNALNSYSSAVFTAPLISAATTKSGHQTWVNNGWDWMKTAKSSYFSDTYNLMNMLYISGNWWKPGGSGESGGVGEEVTWNVVSDTYVRGGTYSNDNYGAETSMTVKKRDQNTSFAREAYLKFEKTPVAGTIQSAKLKLYINSIHSDVTSVPMRAYGLTDNSWSEAGITYANRPASSGVSQGSATAIGTGYIYLDVTSFVQQHTGSLISFRIAGLTEDAGAIIAAKEHSSVSRRPILIINGN